MSPDRALVEVRGVTKAFSASRVPFRRRAGSGTTTVLRGIDLTVTPGESVALLGANGAGKTTLLKMIATLLLPDAGTVSVAGIGTEANHASIRQLVGYVLADERSFHWRLSARRNLEFFARLYGVPRAERSSRIEELLDRLDLSVAGDRMFGLFSTGMKQRLAIARALLHRPRILLMDEPTRSIDGAHAADVWRLVREEVAAVDGCLVLVTHQLQEALSICERVAILADGEIVLDSPSADVERLTADLDGFTVGVRGLAPSEVASLSSVAGIRDVRVATQGASEQVLEVWTNDGERPLATFISELTIRGATICSLQRSTPLQGVLERLLTPSGVLR